MKMIKTIAAAFALAALTATASQAAESKAGGCGCCKGEAASKGASAPMKMGCMGGAAKKDGKAGKGCMAGMGDMAMSQKASDDTMMAGMDHSKMDGSKMEGMDHSKMDMSGGGNKAAASGNPDVDFAKGMIPHHQSAVDMAKELLKTGKDPEMKKLAEDIIAGQEKEIKVLNDWIAKQAK